MTSAVQRFRDELSAELIARGFASRRQGAAFVRRDGSATERIEIKVSDAGASNVRCRLGLVVEDKAIAKCAARWRAGGEMDSPAFARESFGMRPRAPKQLVRSIVEELAFFELARDANAVLADARRRYVPGFVDPTVVAPYLAVRIGADAVATYATSLLAGRPELWPAFLAARGKTSATPARGVMPDQGTELAWMVAQHAPRAKLDPPADAVRGGSDLGAANLRCFVGLQLRAWGEPEAAALLRRVEDGRIRALYAAQEEAGMTVDDRVSAGRALHEALGKKRMPRNEKPSPRFFQYHVLHAPFAA